MNAHSKLDVDRWLAQAAADIDTAHLLIGANRAYAAVLFAQQAAEKALKALLIAQTNDAPLKIHDLVGLGDRVRVPAQLAEQLEGLSSTYLIARYPDASESIPADEFSTDDAVKFLAIAEEVMTWVKRQI